MGVLERTESQPQEASREEREALDSEAMQDAMVRREREDTTVSLAETDRKDRKERRAYVVSTETTVLTEKTASPEARACPA